MKALFIIQRLQQSIAAKIISMAICVLILVCELHSQQIEPNMAAVLTLKVSAMEKQLSESGAGLTIYVADAPEIAKELRKIIGTTIGKSSLVSVQEGNGVPSSIPDIIFIGGTSNAAKLIRFSRQNHILTISNNQEVFDMGTSILLSKDETTGKNYISLNITSSKEEGLEWKPALLKIARSTR